MQAEAHPATACALAVHTKPIKILLVDDQPFVRFGLRLRLNLEPDLAVIGEAIDGAMAVDMAERLEPDVVLMDVKMPRMNGLQAAKRIHETHPASAVVILSMYDDTESRRAAHEYGATGFVCKNGASEPLLAAVRDAADHIKPLP